MSQSQPDRLDRIEATLENVSQQMDNQVALNAELRQSNVELRQSTAELRATVEILQTEVTGLASSISSLRDTVGTIANSVMAIAGSVDALTNVVQSHETQLMENRADILSLQTENRRILDRLEGLENQ